MASYLKITIGFYASAEWYRSILAETIPPEAVFINRIQVLSLHVTELEQQQLSHALKDGEKGSVQLGIAHREKVSSSSKQKLASVPLRFRHEVRKTTSDTR